MSHFTVLVITDHPEQLDSALQPYHEYECTGIMDEHVSFVPALESTEELKREFEENKHKHPDLSTFEEFLNNYHGYELIKDEIGRFTNPNYKWDWWEIGGRWSGFFTLKPDKNGVRGDSSLCGTPYSLDGVDQAQKKDIEPSSIRPTFAVVIDGEWKEQGEMGWWGLADNMNPDWETEFQNIIKRVPDDAWLTLVDCHV